MNDMYTVALPVVLAVLASVSGLSISVNVMLAKKLFSLKSVNRISKTTFSPLQTNATCPESSSDMQTVTHLCSRDCKACILTWLDYLLTSLLRFRR